MRDTHRIDNYLYAFFPTDGPELCAKVLGETPQYIRSRAAVLKLKICKPRKTMVKTADMKRRKMSFDSMNRDIVLLRRAHEELREMNHRLRKENIRLLSGH